MRRVIKMSLTDPVADFLARVRNAIQAHHPKVDVPASKLKLELARILKEEGYVANYKAMEEEGRKFIRVFLGRYEIPRVLGGLGINILTTPKGVMTGREARRQGVGGEVLCEVW